MTVALFDKVEVLNGLGLSVGNREDMDFLINCEKDYDLFMSRFWKGERRQFDAVCDFRLFKIEHLNLSFSDFYDLFQINKKVACECLFQHSVGQADIELLVQRIEEGKVTVTSIYHKHQDNKEIRLLKCLL